MSTLHRSLAIIVGLLLMVSTAWAQDATPTASSETDQSDQQDSLVVCDSTLTLLVALAVRDYGYTNPEWYDMVRGQYDHYFDGELQTPGDGESSATMTPEATMDTPESTTTPEATEVTSAQQGQSDIVMLSPPIVTGEHIRCTEIRASIEDFFSNGDARRPGATQPNQDDSSNANSSG